VFNEIAFWSRIPRPDGFEEGKFPQDRGVRVETGIFIRGSTNYSEGSKGRRDKLKQKVAIQLPPKATELSDS